MKSKSKIYNNWDNAKNKFMLQVKVRIPLNINLSTDTLCDRIYELITVSITVSNLAFMSIFAVINNFFL